MRQMPLDAIEDAALVGGEIGIIHTYKCTYIAVTLSSNSEQQRRDLLGHAVPLLVLFPLCGDE